MTIRAGLLTGTVGVGKTALAAEAGALLGERGLAAAVIDLDWLGWMHGAEPGGNPDALAIENLQAVLPNFEAAGARFFLLARAVQADADVAAIRSALPQAALRVVLVDAPAEVVEERLRRRDTGSELEEHLAATSAWRSAQAALTVDVRLENGRRPIREVAVELIDRLGWDDAAT